jgi:Domain of unknown function (DUF4956)
MAYVLYFRRHWRADLLLSYVALNIGIFVAMSSLTQVRVDLAVGFGLFAILSTIRLRSSAVTQQDVAYYVIALVLGLVNGMGVPDRGLVVALKVVLLPTMICFDSRSLRDRSRRMDVRLAGVYTNETALVAELAQARRPSGLPGDHRDRPHPRGAHRSGWVVSHWPKLFVCGANALVAAKSAWNACGRANHSNIARWSASPSSTSIGRGSYRAGRS